MFKKYFGPISVTLVLTAGFLFAQTLGTTQPQTVGALTATTVNKVTITAPATSATLTIADGKSLTANNILTLAGTDSTTMTFPTTSATIARTDAANTFTGVQTMTSPAITTPVFSGTATGTYTLGGTPTITAPALSGSVTGTYTLAGTPTLTNPVVNGATGNVGGSATAAGFAQTLIDVSTNSAPATQTTFFTINSVTIPASAFNAATRGISCDAWGLTGATGDNKNFKVLFGSNPIYTSVASITLNAKPYAFHFAAVRSGSNTQSGYATFNFDSPTNATFSGSGQATNLAQTESGSIVVAVQVNDTSAAASGGTGNGMICHFDN